VTGSASAAAGTFTIRGSGADVWGTADAFHYVWQPLTGDGDVIARVASVENAAAWVKAGVMIRERLTADSPHAFMIVSAGKGLAFQRRVASGGISTSNSGIPGTAPKWVKLERRGNVISAFWSTDGVNWTFIANDAFTMAADVFVGLAVSSHDNTRLATATFDEVIVR
jgi:regulation of enolase protein 1 (concanavalin A-like superfamily)